MLVPPHFLVTTAFKMRWKDEFRKWLPKLPCLVVFFTLLTDRASTIPSTIRGCQFGTWSAGQKEIRGASIKLQRQEKHKQTKTTKRKEQG